MHVLDDVCNELRAKFDSACTQSARAARLEITNDLNQLLRRLRNYRVESEWVSILLEAAGSFVSEAAIFEVTPEGLRLRGQIGLGLPADLEFKLSSANAFASAVSSRDPVVAMRVADEVTEGLQSSDIGERAHILPLTNGDRVAAVLFAASREYVDVNALELIAGVASVVLERATNQSLHVRVAEPAMTDNTAEQAKHSRKENRDLPAWADLPLPERNLHLQAQRFARVTVAELQMAKPDACRSGRSEKNLYLYLKGSIDQAREQFRARFMQMPSMVDYLHLELVRTAAEGDESRLGDEYPGPLV